MSYYGEYPATAVFPVVDGYPPAHEQQHQQPAGGQYAPVNSYYHEQQPAGSYYQQRHQPAYPQYQHRRQSNGLATTSLVLAILGVLTSWLVVGGVLGLVAVVLGAIAFVKATTGYRTGLGKSITGIVLGFAAMIAAMWFTALYGTLISNVSSTGTELTNCLDNAKGDPFAAQSCFAQFNGIGTQGN